MRNIIKHKISDENFNHLISKLDLAKESYSDSELVVSSCNALKEKLLTYTTFSESEDNIAIIPFFPEELLMLTQILLLICPFHEDTIDYFLQRKKSYKEFLEAKRIKRENDIMSIKDLMNKESGITGIEIARRLELSSSFVYEHWKTTESEDL